MKVVQNVTELVGNTPLVKLNRVVQKNSASVYVKLEFFNPTRSVKDRAALNMFIEAEKQGLITKGSTIIEPTSGNTGIGLAMVGAALGYKTILVMPDSMTLERILILKAYGAEVVLTPGEKRMPGAIEKAEQLAKEIPNSYMPQQFNNIANPDVHRKSTALEIMKAFDGTLDAFVSTAGTGGTITGTGEVLKEMYPSIAIHVVEPQGSPVLSGGQPGNHKIIGTSPGFVPSILNQDVYDCIHLISDEDAIQMTKDLARKEGILVGVSAGAAVHTAVQVAAKLKPDQNVVVIAPDTGERYLSMGFFENLSKSN